MSSLTADEVGEALDKAWIIICGGIIFSMQCGFALLEAGSVRKKNSHIVWHKLIINSLLTSLCWWLFGYAIAFGNADGDFVGGHKFWAGDQWWTSHEEITTQYGHWVFQVSIACVVVAITGGSISERVTLKATAIHTIVMNILIYPFVVSWTWGGGWLAESFHYRDFTGSGIVHCTGAYAGLAGLLVIGPRYNKNGNFKEVFKKEKKEGSELFKHDGPVVLQSQEELCNWRKKLVEDEFEEFGATNISYTLFGALILWFQFIFFNTGSSIFMKTELDWSNAEHGAANTFFGGVGGGLFVLCFKHYLTHGFSTPRKWKEDAAACANAFLGGMVANGAGMDTYHPWQSFIIGVFAGIFYTGACKLFEKLKLDDALEAWQLHGACGTLGVGICAFFNHYDGIFYDNNTEGKVLGRQIFGWFIISAWSFSISLIVWLICKWLNILRVDLKTEIIGYDFIDYADNVSLPNQLLEKHQGGSESVNYELAKRTSD